MCRYITLAVDNTEALRSIFSGFSLSICNNQSILGQLPDGYIAFWLTDGHCSCDLYTIDFDPEEEIEKIYRKYSKPKYRKLGWTARRIQDKIDGLKKKQKTQQGLNVDLQNKLYEYVKQHGQCFLLVSWYSGDIDSETVNIGENIACDLSTPSPTAFNENVLYKLT